MALTPAQQIAAQRVTGGGANVVRGIQTGANRQQPQQVQSPTPQQQAEYDRQMSEYQKQQRQAELINSFFDMVESGRYTAADLYGEYGIVKDLQAQGIDVTILRGRVVRGGANEVIGYTVTTPSGEKLTSNAPEQRLNYQQALVGEYESAQRRATPMYLTPSGFITPYAPQLSTAQKEQNKRIEAYNKLVGETSALGVQFYTPETPTANVMTSSGKMSNELNTYLSQGGMMFAPPTRAELAEAKYWKFWEYWAEGGEKITSLGGRLERPIAFGFGKQVGEVSRTGASSTMTYTWKATTPEERYYRGEITEQEYGSQALKSEVPYTFAKGVSFGVISAVAPPIGGILAGVSFMGTLAKREQVASTFKQYPRESLYNIGAGVAGLIVGGGIVSGVKWAISPNAKIIKITPTKEMQKQVEPYSRQRATVILRTKEGGVVMGRTKNGEIISFGGVANKGETLRQAAYRELGEEVKGLPKVTLKSAGKVVTPEETFHIFTATVPKKVVSQLKGTSDIKSIVYIPAWRANMMARVTGQTKFQPISRLSLYPLGRIRAYESGMLYYLKTGKTPTWLAAETKTGTFILGTQSRYNVPYKVTKAYEQIKEPQLFAHGTSNPPAEQILFKTSFKVLKETGKRGETGLYIQPPSAPASYPRVIKLQGYTGMGTALKSSQIQKLPININPYSEGYVGLSYMGYGSKYEGIGIGYPTKPTAYLFKEKSTAPISLTTKARLGAESERIISVGTSIETAGTYETAFLGGRLATFQPVKIVSGGKASTGVAVTSSYGTKLFMIKPDYLASTGLTSSSKSSLSVSPSKSKVIAPSYKTPEITISQPETYKSDVKYSAPSVSISRVEYKSPSISSPQKPSEISISLSPPAKYKYTPSTSPLKSITETPKSSPSSSLISKARKLLSTEGFKTYVYRGGKKQYLSGVSPRSEAIKKGEKVVLSTVAAKFGIEAARMRVSARNIDYKPSERVFRGYSIRGKTKTPLKDEWIQKMSASSREGGLKSGRLAARSEASELVSFRRKGRRNSIW